MDDVEKRRVGDRGQVTLPKALREAFDISGGDEVAIHEESGKIVIEKPVTREDLAAGYRARAARLRDLNKEMKGVSQEADEQLGDIPEWD
ncbi:AbrB/MazE/SpoVT family DNA-binding domain-containing protein [Haloarcula sp. S1AR25-5A]|uniref:AbrB/MazE/SpoVT family DNA-binding domain-containing protein n=1 Tax=Haloarcula terrestris TaxID=2950533 RepID=A0AAE4EVK2_9EURY|nr:AbrB/MazE/SpoVT family DNA-binding domain-containing protein [Haloarcula terrestris]MDS0220960.1 AbrB/MazE/SpoVT family DNA-binding domain-containing protein [Haloarcula terrestris]